MYTSANIYISTRIKLKMTTWQNQEFTDTATTPLNFNRAQGRRSLRKGVTKKCTTSPPSSGEGRHVGHFFPCRGTPMNPKAEGKEPQRVHTSLPPFSGEATDAVHFSAFFFIHFHFHRGAPFEEQKSPETERHQKLKPPSECLPHARKMPPSIYNKYSN